MNEGYISIKCMYSETTGLSINPLNGISKLLLYTKKVLLARIYTTISLNDILRA